MDVYFVLARLYFSHFMNASCHFHIFTFDMSRISHKFSLTSIHLHLLHPANMIQQKSQGDREKLCCIDMDQEVKFIFEKGITFEFLVFTKIIANFGKKIEKTIPLIDPT